MRGLARGLLGALALGSSLAAIHCGDETETQPVLSDRDTFALAVAAILCDGAKSCCTERQLPAPGEGCTTEMRNQVFISLLEAEDERQVVTLDTSDDCLTAYKSALGAADTCDTLPHPRDMQTICPDLFSDVPIGKGKPGDMCDHLYDCSAPEVGDRACYRLDTTSPGVCVWVVPVAAGESCAAPTGVFTQCPDGQGCVENATGDDLICDTAHGFGEACVADNSCGVGLLCNVDTCQDALALGDICTDWPGGCGAGMFCDGSICETLPIIAQCESGGCISPLEAYCQQ